MTDDYGTSSDGAERRALVRVSLVATGLILAGVSLGIWEDKQDARPHLPHMTVADKSG